MFIFINALLIGIASGLRALIGLTAVSWAVHFGILPLDHTWLAWLGYAFTSYILTLMAIGELVNDKLPNTPSRKVPPQFIGRVLSGRLVGATVGAAAGSLVGGVLTGAGGTVWAIAARLKTKNTAVARRRSNPMVERMLSSFFSSPSCPRR
jgi:uncharacterized membrane protein